MAQCGFEKLQLSHSHNIWVRKLLKMLLVYSSAVIIAIRPPETSLEQNNTSWVRPWPSRNVYHQWHIYEGKATPRPGVKKKKILIVWLLYSKLEPRLKITDLKIIECFVQSCRLRNAHSMYSRRQNTNLQWCVLRGRISWLGKKGSYE